MATKHTTWSVTWDRRNKDGSPMLDRKGNVKRTGNRFFSKAEAQQVYDIRVAEGRNPTPLKEEQLDWIGL